MIRKLEGQYLITRNYASSGKNTHSKSGVIIKDDYEFKVKLKGYGDAGYFMIGERRMIDAPAELIGKTIRIKIEIVDEGE